MKKYCIHDQKGSLHYIKAKNLEDAMSKIQHLQDAYVEEWWSLNIDESPYAFARKYGLTIEILKTRRDEVLYRFSGSKQQISKAMKKGYFYESEKYGDSITDGFNVEGMKKNIPALLRDVKEAYNLVLRSAKDWVVQVPEDLEYLAHKSYIAAKKFREISKQYFTDSIKDEDELNYLSDEEQQAIEDYKEAIKGTSDLKLLKLYAHILQEEIEHLEELQNEDIEGE